MGKLTTLVGRFSTRGKDKGGVLDQPDRRESTPPRGEQQKAEGSVGPYGDRNGRHALGPELSEDSDRGEGAHDVAAFGSDVSTEFKRDAPHTYSGELDGLVVTRPTFQSMVFQRPKNAAGDSKVCASCRKDADPRHPGSLFTAECGHTFHFECIALGLDLGQLRCPLCRKTWRRLPDTGAWANGALGYSYQGQPLNRKGAGARPPRSGRPSNAPPPAADEDDVDLDDIPVAPVIHPANHRQGPGPAGSALERPPTFRDMTGAETEPSEGFPGLAFQGSWAKRPLRLDADEYDAEQSPADPFHFHHSERFSEASPGGLDDLPSPVALKRGGDFAKRKEGGGVSEPEFCFGMTAKSDPQEPDRSAPEAAPARDTGGVNMPVQPPALKINKPGSAPVPGPQAPPVFARRRRTSKDSAPLPSIIEAASPDRKSIHLKPPPGRRTPAISPRRRYERRQAAANAEETLTAPRLAANPLEEKRRSHTSDGENGASEGGQRGAGSLPPPPGKASLPPPPGRGVRPAASKLDDQDWARFFAPSREFEPARPSPGDSGSDEESPPGRGLAEAPYSAAEPSGKAPKDVNANQGPGGKAPGAEAVPGDDVWDQSAGILTSEGALPPDHPLFPSYAKAFKVLHGHPPEAVGADKSPLSSRAGSLSPEPERASLSPTKQGRPPREFPEHLESFRVSVPAADGTWSSMDDTERDIRVDTNSNIVYSRSAERPQAAGERPSAADERPNPIADSRGWFYNSGFGSDGISEVLRGVAAKRGADQPEAWHQAGGHQFGGSLQADGGFDMARFEAAIGPEVYDDDDPVTPLQPIPGSAPDLEISVRSEHPAVAAADSRDKFLCLVTVKAAPLAKPPASNPSSSNQSPPGASSHHSRRASGSGRSLDSDPGTSGVPSRRRTGSRGSAELESLDWPRGAGDRLQRAGSADVALLQPLEKRDSADLHGWLTEQMTERLRLQESVCPAPEAPPEPDVRAPEEARAPLDLVAVLDVSKSMMGRKLRLVQKTIEFVTQNLGPNDRLSVVAFSKRAYRVAPLLRVTDRGRERIVSAVKRIEVSSGTNIGAGLRMGLKVLKDARTRNPVRAVVLLSDGQDSWGRRGMSLLLPEWGVTDGAGVAVHTFGFGGDHDAEAMFSVASEAKGTYSFIKKTEGVQDAFARCIGGLLTVVAQDVTLSLQVGGNGSGNGCRIQHLHAGVFERTVDEAGTRAEVVLGDMYAEEARDILVELSLPEYAGSIGSDARQLVLAASGNYVQARTQLIKAVASTELVISRPLQVPVGEGHVDIDVDRQRNRLIATRAMSTAREWAELGQLGAAQKMLENAIAQIGQSASFAGGDPLTLQLDYDLRECAVGFASMDEYEERGRAFSMSQGLSHTMQRASTSTFRRGSRTGSAGYSTSTMEFMINRSQCFEVKR